MQCILYFILGYILREYTWTQCIVIFAILLGIQFITHIKGVSQGMFMYQIMEEDRHHLIKFIKQMEEDKNNEKPN